MYFVVGNVVGKDKAVGWANSIISSMGDPSSSKPLETVATNGFTVTVPASTVKSGSSLEVITTLREPTPEPEPDSTTFHAPDAVVFSNRIIVTDFFGFTLYCSVPELSSICTVPLDNLLEKTVMVQPVGNVVAFGRVTL